MHSLYTALLLARHSGSHKADHLHGPAKHWDIVTSSHSVILSHSESFWSVEIYRIYIFALFCSHLSDPSALCFRTFRDQVKPLFPSEQQPATACASFALFSDSTWLSQLQTESLWHRWHLWHLWHLCLPCLSHVLVGALQGRILRLPLGRAADAFSRFSVKEVC